MDERDIIRIIKRYEKDKKGKRKTLDIVIILLAFFMFFFIVTMIIIFCIKGSIPDTLVSCVLGGGAVELILTAWITNTKKKYESEEES